MKKLIFLAIASILAFSCDAPNRSSEEGAGSESEERAPADPAEGSDIHSDTTTSGGMNRQNQYDTLK